MAAQPSRRRGPVENLRTNGGYRVHGCRTRHRKSLHPRCLARCPWHVHSLSRSSSLAWIWQFSKMTVASGLSEAPSQINVRQPSWATRAKNRATHQRSAVPHRVVAGAAPAMARTRRHGAGRANGIDAVLRRHSGRGGAAPGGLALAPDPPERGACVRFRFPLCCASSRSQSPAMAGQGAAPSSPAAVTQPATRPQVPCRACASSPPAAPSAIAAADGSPPRRWSRQCRAWPTSRRVEIRAVCQRRQRRDHARPVAGAGAAPQRAVPRRSAVVGHRRDERDRHARGTRLLPSPDRARSPARRRHRLDAQPEPDRLRGTGQPARVGASGRRRARRRDAECSWC